MSSTTITLPLPVGRILYPVSGTVMVVQPAPVARTCTDNDGGSGGSIIVGGTNEKRPWRDEGGGATGTACVCVYV